MKDKKWLLNALNLDKVIDSLTKYVELKLEIYKLQLKEQLVHLISGVIVFVMIISFGLFVLFFFSMSAAYYLNEVLESKFLGLMVVGGIYLVICIVLIIFKDKIITHGLFKAFFEDTLTSEKNENGDDD